MSTLGIDVGTTGCKVAAYADDGTQLHLAYRNYALQRPQTGWCELPAKKVWESVLSAISEVAAASKVDPVTALCVSSIGEAMTPVDREGRILANCILSNDSRGSEYSTQLSAAMPSKDFYHINPNIISPNYSYPKLAWIRDRQPDLYRQTDTFLLWDGLISRLLGGADFASFSLANRTLLFDIQKEDWSPRLLQLAGIERDKLPPCLPAGALAGEVSDTMACKLGLPTGVKIVVGGHDQCLNALGAGVVKAGMAVAGLGTYECITPVYTGLAEQDNLQAMGLNIEHYVIPSMYVSFLFNQAGSLIQWFRSVCAGEGSENLDRLQAEMPDDPTDLLVLPYFEPSGSPGYVNDASGVILGLKMQTTRGDILKAIMESTSYYFLELWQHFASSQSEMVVSGGGAKSDRWLQIKADIYGVPVCRPQNTECGTLGAAMLAASVVHALDDLTHAMLERVKHCVRVERTFEPDTQRHNIYRQRAAYYRELFPAWYGKLAQWHQLTRKAYV